jgi:5-formyltetrahydrofolate cyclo-ligase
VNQLGEDPVSKSEWRSQLLDARRAVPADVRAIEAKALARAVLKVSSETVCCYLPVGSEPGSPELVNALVADGRRVLLPVVTGPSPLDWAEYRGPDDLAPGPHGLREPAGPRLGPAAIGQAATILIPALAIDRRGVRLGRGGGHYDRSLPLAAPTAVLVGVVRDEELVDRLPAEPHDILVGSVLTPVGGLRPVAGT